MIPNDDLQARLDAHIAAYGVEIADVREMTLRHEQTLYGDPKRGIEGVVQRGYRLDAGVHSLQTMTTVLIFLCIGILLTVLLLLVITLR